MLSVSARAIVTPTRSLFSVVRGPQRHHRRRTARDHRRSVSRLRRGRVARSSSTPRGPAVTGVLSRSFHTAASLSPEGLVSSEKKFTTTRSERSRGNRNKIIEKLATGTLKSPEADRRSLSSWPFVFLALATSERTAAHEDPGDR